MDFADDIAAALAADVPGNYTMTWGEGNSARIALERDPQAVRMGGIVVDGMEVIATGMDSDLSGLKNNDVVEIDSTTYRLMRNPFRMADGITVELYLGKN